MKMVKTYYTKAWTIKPYKHSRPFIKLKDYDDLRKKYEKIKKRIKNQGVVNNE